MRYVVFVATGEITKVLDVPPDSIAANIEPGEQYISVNDDFDGRLHYIDIPGGNLVIDRPLMPITVPFTTASVNVELVFTGVPVGTVVRHPQGLTTVTDGSIEWESADPGSFQLFLRNFPYQDEVLRVEITSA